MNRTARAARIAVAAVALLAAFLLLAGFWVDRRLDASLPILDGEVAIAGLSAPVVVERDGAGVPTVRGQNRLGVARGTGFLHAQDRFFQMDLLRRFSAGRSAELLPGEGPLALDRATRAHLLTERADAAWAGLPGEQRALLEAYAAGVNAGLEELGAPPFEYVLLGQEPERWQGRDSLLVIWTMFLRLQDEAGDLDAGRGELLAELGDDLFSFLFPDRSRWGAPLPSLGDAAGDTAGAPGDGPSPAELAPGNKAVAMGAVPPASRPALRRRHGGLRETVARHQRGGSNVWALAGKHTADGRPLLANDMHLQLSLPATWYRMVLTWPGQRQPHRLVGLTLPGVPLLVVGSNGRVAWGLANSEADVSDVVLVEEMPGDPGSYLTGDGAKPFDVRSEVLRSRGGGEETLEVRWTRWGPVVGDGEQGLRVVRWVGHEPGAVDLSFAGMETASTVAEALEVARRSGMPAQSLLVVDRDGGVGWSIAGRLPDRRRGYDASVPVAGRGVSSLWRGLLDPADAPRVVDPPGGLLWAANQRLATAGRAAELLGDGDYALGARASRIRDRLATMDGATEGDLLGLQLDDRSPLMERWRQLLLSLLTPEAVAADPRRDELRRLVEEWDGRASPGSAGYRLLRGFRLTAGEELLAEVAGLDGEGEILEYLALTDLWEEPLWTLVAQRPPGRLPTGWESWRERLLAVVDSTLDYYTADGRPLAEKTWGQVNVLRLEHPLASLPLAGRFLGLSRPPVALPGDVHVPRLQFLSNGASQRLVVSPGREDEGISQLPGGQSGHPRSPYFADGVDDWVSGRQAPLLPGATVHRLHLIPPAGG